MALTESQIAERIEAARGPSARLYRPLSAIAQSVPSVAGLMLGLPYVDRLTGGLRPRKLNLVVGFSSHGKTSLMLSTIVRHTDKRAIFVSADDTDDILLHKLIAMHASISTEQVALEGPKWRSAYAAEHFPLLEICTPVTGSTYSVDEVSYMYDEISDLKGGPVEIVGFDYMSLISLRQGETDNGAFAIKQKALQLKELIRRTPDAVWMVGQQCNRAAASNSNGLRMEHIEFGGVQETDGVIIGCRRRSHTEQLTDHQIWEESRCPTTNLSVMKNKITGRCSDGWVGVPHAIDPTSGLVRELMQEDHKPSMPERPTVPQVRFNPQPAPYYVVSDTA